MLKSLLANVIICGLLLFLFAYFELGILITFYEVAIPDLSITGENILALVISFATLGFVFWILNSPIKSILKVLSFPVNALTLWLFSLVINVIIFYVFAWIATTYLPDVSIQLGNIIQTLILSFVMALGITILKKFI